MFSTTTEATRRSASPAGGFGSRAHGQANAFGFDGAGDVSSKKDKRKKQNGAKPAFNPFAQNAGTAKPGQGDKRGKRQVQPFGDMNDDNDRTRSSASDGPSSPPGSEPESNDPYARRIYRQLHADGITPPPWPSNPGRDGSKSAMARFREKHEDYRQRVRRSLTKAGLIDDPNKRKKLSEAISFKGICEDMCPEYEKIQRITESDVVKAEKTGGVADLSHMVKKLARSAAGQEAPLPMDVRSTRALGLSLDYMFGTLLREDENLRHLHGFVWDRTRAIRRDFAFFSTMSESELKTQIYVLENIARFHVTALHLLPQFVSPGDRIEDLFSEHQELEQLGKTLLSLRDIYDDCRAQDITCENEAEFRAYYLLFHGRDPAIVESLQLQWDPRFWDESEEVRIALSLVEAMHNNQDFVGSVKHKEDGPLLACTSAYMTFFDIVESVSTSYTMACFAECHFPHVRRAILQAVKRALTRPKNPIEDVTAEALNEFLRYDTVEQAIEFAELHGMSFTPNPEDPNNVHKYGLVLRDRASVPYAKVDHQFSRRLVENKRGNATLPQILRRTVYDRVSSSTYLPNGGREESLFVEDTAQPGLSSPNMAPTEPGMTTNQPVFGAGAFGTASSTQPQPKAPKTQGGFIVESDSESDTEAPRKALPTFGGIAAKPGAWQQTNGASNPFSTTSSITATQGVITTQSQANPFAPSGAVGESKAEPKPNPFASAPGFGTKTGNAAPTKLNPFAGAFQPGSSGTTPSASPFETPKPSFGQASPFSAAKQPAATEGVVSNSSAFAKPSTVAPVSQVFGAPTTSTTTQSAVGASPGAPKAASSVFATPGATPSIFGKAADNTPKGPQAATGSPAPFASAPSGTVPPVASGATSSPPSAGLLGAAKPGLLGQTGPQVSFPPLVSSAAAQPSTKAVSQSPSTNQGKPFSSGLLGTVTPAAPSASTGPPTLGLDKPARAPSTASPLPADKAPEPPKEPPGPPRDLLGDFTNWFVKGDGGLMSDFIVESVRLITRDAFEQFTKESEENRRREEEERIDAEVEKFRTYNLSLKYFYRWKRNAREKRLRAVRRKGRDEMRAFLAARQAADRKARDDALRASQRPGGSVPGQETPEHSKEFLELMKSKRQAKRDATDSLLASGVLSGLKQEREMARAIVNEELGSSNGSQSSRRPSFSSSVGTSRKEGSKTQALRRMYFDQPERFRRSLPSLSSEDRGSPGPTKRSSNASSRWRLKAMGIVPLEDGTAVPESLAREMTASGMLRYSRSVSPWRRRRMSATSAVQSGMQRSPPTSYGGAGNSPVNNTTLNSKRKRDDASTSDLGLVDGGSNKRVMSDTDRPGIGSAVEASPANKRKRAVDDDDDGGDADSPTTDGVAQKRILSDAERVTMELQALRAEMEEGTEWYKSQIERFRSESEARGTPWFDESI
ncbi:GANP/Nin1/mts3/eIF-3 p25 family protein [Purpureocillium lavendulum]|uniref:GANP/Nin1/mts3/eIF-3 p25 family protein n=1 Tax=Purpureocillium lavendulum TaxID=1247861 RepID=A0AB34FIR7_9HYPO|nr:GANP/Nin1/mts3/eIF-3 p25 family protein [Purpureocillium lavendulum]